MSNSRHHLVPSSSSGSLTGGVDPSFPVPDYGSDYADTEDDDARSTDQRTMGFTDQGTMGFTDQGAMGFTDQGAMGFTDQGAMGFTDQGAMGFTDQGAMGFTDQGAMGFTDQGAMGFTDQRTMEVTNLTNQDISHSNPEFGGEMPLGFGVRNTSQNTGSMESIDSEIPAVSVSIPRVSISNPGVSVSIPPVSIPGVPVSIPRVESIPRVADSISTSTNPWHDEIKTQGSNPRRTESSPDDDRRLSYEDNWSFRNPGQEVILSTARSVQSFPGQEVTLHRSVVLDPRDLNTRDLNTRDLNTRDLNTRDLNARDLNARDLNERDRNLRDLNPRDLNQRDLDPRDVGQIVPATPEDTRYRQSYISNSADLKPDEEYTVQGSHDGGQKDVGNSGVRGFYTPGNFNPQVQQRRDPGLQFDQGQGQGQGQAYGRAQPQEGTYQRRAQHSSSNIPTTEMKTASNIQSLQQRTNERTIASRQPAKVSSTPEIRIDPSEAKMKLDEETESGRGQRIRVKSIEGLQGPTFEMETLRSPSYDTHPQGMSN
jgi:hypothetical protein